MTTYGWRSAAMGAVVGLLVLGPWLRAARAGEVNQAPPSPIQVGTEKAPVKVDLPSKPVETPKAEEGPKAPVAEAPRKVWKLLAPAHVVSEKSSAYLWIPDFKRAQKGYSRSQLAGLLGEEELQQQLLKILGRVRLAYVEGDGTLADIETRRRAAELDLLGKLFGLLEGTAAVAVDAPVATEKVSSGLPRFMLVVGMKDDKCQQEIANLLESFASNQLLDTRFRDDAAKIGPYEIRLIRADEIEVHESWAFVENLFLYGWGKGIVEEAVTAYSQRNGQGTLALNPGFAAASQRVGSDALVYAHYDGDLTPLTKAMGELSWIPWWVRSVFIRPMLQGLGQEHPKMAVGLGVEEGAQQAPLREKLLLRSSRAPAPSFGPCRALSRYLASSDALAIRAEQRSLTDLLKLLADEGAGAEPGAGAKILAGLKNALKQEDQEGVWKQLAPFKGELAVIVDYVPGESLQKDWQDVFQVVFALEVDRAEVANANNALNLLREATEIPYRTLTFQGTNIWYQQGATPEDRAKAYEPRPLLTPRPAKATEKEGIPFFVSYAIHEVVSPNANEPGKTFLLLSDSLKALKKAIQQSRLPRHSLGDQPEFKKLMAAFDEGRYGQTYLDLPGLFSGIYRQMLPEAVKLRWLRKETLTELPPDTAVMHHLSPMAWASTVREEGDLTEIISPAGNVPLVGLVAALAWPTYYAQEQQRIAVQAKENLKQIGLGLHLYAAVFDRFPARLSDLYPEYVKDLRVFASPFDRAAVKRPEDIDDWRKSNLVYVPGRSFQDLSQDILVYEVRPTFAQQTEDGGFRALHYVLQLDGKVNPKPLSRLKRLLEGVRNPLTTAEKPAAGTTPEKQP